MIASLKKESGLLSTFHNSYRCNFFPTSTNGVLVTGAIEIEINYNAKRVYGKKNPS